MSLAVFNIVSHVDSQWEITEGTVSGGDVFTAAVSDTPGRAEKRTQFSWYPLFKGSIQGLIVGCREMDYIVAFTNARRGKAQSFRWRIPWDNKTSAAQDYTGDTNWTRGRVIDLTPSPAPSRTWQLCKEYADGGSATFRPITCPDKVFEIQADGVPVTGFTVSDRGVVTGLPTAALLTWTGTFDIPVRFDTEQITISMVRFDPTSGVSLYKISDLPIQEVILL